MRGNTSAAMHDLHKECEYLARRTLKLRLRYTDGFSELVKPGLHPTQARRVNIHAGFKAIETNGLFLLARLSLQNEK
jgi:hypothetical protein